MMPGLPAGEVEVDEDRIVWSADMTSCKVLLAEDDEVSRDLVRLLLAGLGRFDITCVGDGRAALLAASTKAFDLLILDHNLPEIPGDRLLRQLRLSRNSNTTTPVIFYSASIAAPRQVQGGRAAEWHMPKPIDFTAFAQAVRSLVPEQTEAFEDMS